jgi:hypothetical protein
VEVVALHILVTPQHKDKVVLVEAGLIGVKPHLVPEIKVILEQVEVNPQMQVAVAAVVAIRLVVHRELLTVEVLVEMVVHTILEVT